MTKESFKALFSERYKKISQNILKDEPERVLIAQEVGALLWDARQAESVILAGMTAVLRQNTTIDSLEKWEECFLEEALDIIFHPELFTKSKTQKAGDKLKTPSREASDIAAALLTVDLRRQLERHIRCNDSISKFEGLTLPLYRVGKKPFSPYESQQELEYVFTEYHERLIRLWRSPISENFKFYLDMAMERCCSEPFFTYNERPVYCIHGNLSGELDAKVLHMLFRAGFYYYWDKKTDNLYVSSRKSWKRDLAKLMTAWVSVSPELDITLSQSVKFDSCDWHIEPVHSYEWDKVLERQAFQKLISSCDVLKLIRTLRANKKIADK